MMIYLVEVARKSGINLDAEGFHEYLDDNTILLKKEEIIRTGIWKERNEISEKSEEVCEEFYLP